MRRNRQQPIGRLRCWLAALLMATLSLAATMPPALADDAPVWQRIDKKGIKSGSVQFGYGDVVAITCPASLPTAQPRLLVHVLALLNAYDSKTRYNLRISINDYRADFAMTPQDGTLLFEAKDFNQRDMFQSFVQELMNAGQNGVDHAQMAIFSLGWRGDLPLAAIDQVLPGLMDGCGE